MSLLERFRCKAMFIANVFVAAFRNRDGSLAPPATFHIPNGGIPDLLRLL